jgi:hypothetical protein
VWWMKIVGFKGGFMKLVRELGTRNRKNSPDRRDMWALFECEYCGEFVERVKQNGLVNLSCGCARYKLSAKSNSTPGFDSIKKHPLYAIGHALLQRCYDVNNSRYKNYGKRGISVCDEWRNDRSSFVKWGIANGYKHGLQIDRINNNLGYFPDNCRFVTCSENSRNRTTTVCTPKMVSEMRFDHEVNGLSGKSVSVKYGVSTTNVNRILNYKIW